MSDAPDISRASKILGQDLYNQQGEEIGEIEELVLDPNTGQVQQVIISAGGFLGMGQKNVALPWNQVKLMQVDGNQVRPASGTAGTAGTVTGTGNPPAARAAGPGAPATDAAADRNRERNMRFVANVTKDQLRAAPEYKDDRREQRR